MARFPACLPLLSASPCLAGVARAQSPITTPTPPTLSRIVAIGVVVTDKQGKPGKNLKLSIFALAENGTNQTLSHFEVHTSVPVKDENFLRIGVEDLGDEPDGRR